MLKDRGVEVIFGIPGVHNQEMYRGIEESGLRHVLARHEQGCGFMADGYARATGRPGVCYVISGPGLCNIMTPMGQAYSDSVPMLVISSCLDETAARRGQLHQMKDQETAARCVAEWSETARTADAAYELIDRALVEFAAQRPRPKHIQVPIRSLEGRAERFGPGPAFSANSPSRPDQLQIDKAAKMMAQATRPLIVFGGGAVPGCDAARALLDRSGAATICTYAGRGVIAGDHAMNLGASLPRPGSVQVFREADLVIAIGTSLSEVDLWRDHPGHTCPLIRIDIDPEVLASLPAVMMIAADANAAMSALTDALPAGAAAKWDAAQIAAWRVQRRSEVMAEYPGIVEIGDALRAALPPDTMIFSDMTQFAYAAKEAWPMDRPGHWHHPYGFGTLGYGLPAAIGGAIGRPGQPTIALAGDYGFQYTVQELATAVELGLTLPIILWDNGKLGAIEDSMIKAQIAPNAVIQRNPDFLKLAEAYGARSAAPRSLAALQAAVAKALAADGPTLIHVTPETGDS
jgi:acetolactate synthase-1/2/3 large subunit/5-guanidino-2-oxopentanoate decarboxylase